MLFNHENVINKKGEYIIGDNISAVAHSIFCTDIYKELWQGYTFKTSQLDISQTKELVFIAGNAEKPELEDNDYAINITENGICVVGNNEKNLIYGFMTMLDCIVWDDSLDCTKIPCCEIKESALVKNRMVHYCVFPETELWEVQRFMRFAAVLKYSHVIIEFWGMLKYECLKELAWEQAFSKEEIKPIIEEANALGLEVVPMFNHWGHATGSRVKCGKHVVLDQNPTLQKYFTESGWCWNIKRDDVKELLRKVRGELIELCGAGSYFHIGCDEAYGFDFSKKSMDDICGFINEISEELAQENRRVIIWGDMLLEKRSDYKKEYYWCVCPDNECEKYMVNSISKDVVVADWQYSVGECPVKTSLVLDDYGFDVMCCPWDEGHPLNKYVCIDTTIQNNLYGLIFTTWHILSEIMPSVTDVGVLLWGKKTEGHLEANTAAVLRKIYDVGGDYRKSGWSKKQINN